VDIQFVESDVHCIGPELQPIVQRSLQPQWIAAKLIAIGREMQKGGNIGFPGCSFTEVQGIHQTKAGSRTYLSSEETLDRPTIPGRVGNDKTGRDSMVFSQAPCNLHGVVANPIKFRKEARNDLDETHRAIVYDQAISSVLRRTVAVFTVDTQTKALS
jgi:hypothetical protein